MRNFAAWLILAVAVGASTSPARSDDATAAVKLLAKYAPEKEYTVEPFGLVRFDTGIKSPRWVLHQITAESIQGHASREGLNFFADPSIEARWQTHPGWWTNSGWARGHCAPCADFKHSQRLTKACMSLKNVMVQDSATNSGQWLQLEHSVRTLADDDHVVTILTGPAWKSDGKAIVSTKVIHGIVAGTHTFKAVLLEKGPVKECFAWLAPNSPPDPKNPPGFDSWRISTDELEDVVGFDLWPNLTADESKAIEKRR